MKIGLPTQQDIRGFRHAPKANKGKTKDAELF